MKPWIVSLLMVAAWASGYGYREARHRTEHPPEKPKCYLRSDAFGHAHLNNAESYGAHIATGSVDDLYKIADRLGCEVVP